MRVPFLNKRVFFSTVVTILLLWCVIGVTQARANILNNLRELFTKNNQPIALSEKVLTSDKLLRPKPSLEDDNSSNTPLINSDGTLLVQSGTMRVSTEKEKVIDGTISLYEVKRGDSLGTVANLFGVSVNTIIWANDLKDRNIHPGESLLIFPMNGLEYIVKNSGTLEDVAKKYKADAKEIAEYNGLSLNTKLAAGDKVFIPDAEANLPTETKTSTSKKSPSLSLKNNAKIGYFMLPVSGCVRTQGLHGPYHSAVDLGCKVGTKVSAAASGVVIRASSSGYNGGYGEVVIISHPNGTQTIYAHLSRVEVGVGEQVKQGEIIGTTGSTGRSTGPHLHFETRGTANPF